MGVRLLVRTDLRNDKDKRSLRLSQEVNQFDSFPNFHWTSFSIQGIAIINKYFSKRRIEIEESDLIVLLSHAHTYFTNLSESVQNQLQNISEGLSVYFDKFC